MSLLNMYRLFSIYNLYSIFIVLGILNNLEVKSIREDVHRLYANKASVYIRNMSMCILESTGGPGTNFLQIAWDSCKTSVQT